LAGPVLLVSCRLRVELEAVVRAMPEGVAQLVTGPEGNSALRLVHERR
jgi:hypothetical protein